MYYSQKNSEWYNCEKYNIHEENLISYIFLHIYKASIFKCNIKKTSLKLTKQYKIRKITWYITQVFSMNGKIQYIQKDL